MGELDNPKNVQIKIYHVYNWPAADMHLPEINMGIQYGIRNENQSKKIYTKNPTYSEAILAHEYGHLVFRENYIKLEPLMKKSEDLYFELKASQKESKLIDEKIEVLMNKASSTQNDEKMNLQAEVSRLFDEQMQVQKKGLRAIELANKIDSLIAPYSEFFADVVAVLHTQKANAISDAITFSLNNQMSGHKQTKFNRDSRDFKNNIRHPKDMEDHHFFSMARSYMWTSYLASPSIMKNGKSKIISAVFMAVAKETSRQLNKESSMAPTWKDANESLISSIEAEMSLRGIEPLK